MFGKILSEQHQLTPEEFAKRNTEWHVQIVNGMLDKRVIGYAETMVRKALVQQKLTNDFNWKFYESVAKLKLLQLKKKVSLRVDDYALVPNLIEKEMKKHNVRSDLDNYRLIMIRNEYL